VVALAVLLALKGIGKRAFYRWLARDYKPLFPNLPEPTRLFRLFNSHRHWTQLFMADHSLIGLVDSFGIELIHPSVKAAVTSKLVKKDCQISAGSSAQSCVMSSITLD
jgi:hypothetical protein